MEDLKAGGEDSGRSQPRSVSLVHIDGQHVFHYVGPALPIYVAERIVLAVLMVRVQHLASYDCREILGNRSWNRHRPVCGNASFLDVVVAVVPQVSEGRPLKAPGGSATGIIV